MHDNTLLTIFLPVALATVMAGLGLHLTPVDFRRVVKQPRAVLVALVVQCLLLPPVAFVLASALRLSPEFAVGLVLLAASPGGVTANIFSHLARGDVALNVTLSAVNSLLALVTLPLWTALALELFLGTEGSVPPPLRKVVEVAMIAIAPVALGMALRAWKPRIAEAARKPVQWLSTMVLVLLIVLAVASEFSTLVEHALAVGLACVAFNLISLFSGYFAGVFAKLARPKSIAIGFEISIHNSTLAILLALQVLESELMAIPAAMYAVLMYPSAAAFAFWLLWQSRGEFPARHTHDVRAIQVREQRVSGAAVRGGMDHRGLRAPSRQRGVRRI